MPGPYSAGAIFLQVIPSFRGVPQEIAREAKTWGQAAGQEFDDSFEHQVVQNMPKAVRKAAAQGRDGAGQAGQEAGDEYAGRFQQSLKQGISKAQREIDKLKINVDDKAARKKLTELQVGLKGLNARIGVDIDSGKALLQFAALEQKARDLHDAAGTLEFRSNIGAAIRGMETLRGEIESLSRLDIEPNLKVDKQLGLFERSLKEGMSRALNDLPPIELDTTHATVQVAELREAMHELGNVDIGVDVDASAAFAKVALLEEELRTVADSAQDMKLRVDAAGALKTVAGVRAELEALSRLTIEPHVEVQVDRQQGAFERALRSSIQNAIHDLGPVDIPYDPRLSNAGQRAIADLRRQLFGLSDKTIGIDISAETAVAELHRIRDELLQLTREGWGVEVDADTAAAAVQLEALLKMLNRLDGDTAVIDVDVRGAASAAAELVALAAEEEHVHRSSTNAANSFRAFNGVLFGLTTIGPAAIPVLGALAGGLLAMGPLAAAGAAGLGVFALGLSGIGAAVKALNQAQNTSTTQQQTYQRAVVSASNGIRDAEQGVSRAREDSARSAQDSERAVQSALSGVETAERGVRDAQRDRQRAQEDLTRAVKDATEQQEDLTLSLRDSQLSEEETALNLRQAQEALQEGIASGATGDDLLELQLRVQRYQLSLDQARERTGDLQDQTAEFARTGVEGTDAVRSARERLSDADQRIADAQQRVAEAQASVEEARLNQQRQASDSARTVQDAQERLTDAQVRYTEALDNVNTAQQNVANTMAALSPAGRDFATFLVGLKDDFQVLRAVAQEGFLPGLQDWMSTITTFYGPALQRTVFNLSSAVGDMFTKFSGALISRPFQQLFAMIEEDGPRFIGYLGDVLVNLGKGTASLIVALEPLADLFGQWFVAASARFADWAASLQGSNGLTDFFSFIERVGPKVGDLLLAAGGAIANLAKALAPYGEILLDILTDVFEFISNMDTDKLGAITVGLISAIGAMQVIFGFTAGLKSILEAWRGLATIGELVGRRWGVVLGAFVLLAGALFILYQNSETFRTVVDTLWRNVLQPVAEFLGNVLMPILEGLTGFFSEHIELVAGIAAAFGAWKILTTVIGYVNGLKTAVGGLNGALGRAGLAGLIGVVVAGAGFAESQHQQETQRISSDTAGLFGQLRQGGDEATEARRLLGLQEQNSGGFFDTLEGVFGTSNSEILAQQHRAFTQQWTDMTDLEKAQSKVAEWTKTLADRQSSGTATADELSAAHRRLTYWSDQVEQEQHQLDFAASGVNTTLLAQQGIAIGLAQADIAYQQSMDALDSAHANYINTLNNEASTEEEVAAAREQWTNQSLATAQAAGQVAAARHANADANTREAYQNAALLIDLERQKELYGELPPRLEELRSSLESTVDPAIIAVTKMEELGIKVRDIPDEKTIVFDGEPTQEQIALMESLGFKIEHLPDGTIVATAETQAAENALAQVARDRTSTITQTVTFNTEANRLAHENVGQTGGFGLAHGGPIWGPGSPTSDSIPAWLSNGEYVVRAKAVQKYGLDFFHKVNAMRYAKGGHVGAPGFAGGGLAATWGGTIDLQGGDVSPLAQLWVQAVIQINQLAQMGADLISAQFQRMAASVLGVLTELRTNMLATWLNQNSLLVAATGLLSTQQTGVFVQMGVNLLNLTGATTNALTGQWLQHDATMLQLGTATNSALIGQQITFGATMLQLGAATSSALIGQQINLGGTLLQLETTLATALESRWSTLGVTMIQLSAGMATAIGVHFDRLRHLTADPINFIILWVLNNGLINALNGISSTFGLPTVPAAVPIGKFAAGGRVWGSSPHKRADNIPAMLTAGEFVQPVDTVDYYGADFMEALRRRRIPRGILPGFAIGGPVTWQQLNAIRAKLFPNSVMTSGYRPGANDYHGAGMAIDIGVSGNLQSGLMPIAATIASMYPQSAELIHNPNASIKNGQRVPASFWGAATWAAHANHVHWAMTMAQLLLGPNPAGGFAGGATPADIFGQLTASIADPVKKLVETFGSSQFVGNLAAIPSKLVVGIWDKIKDQVAAALTFGGQGSLEGVQTTGPIQDIVRSVASQFGWGTGAEWDAIAWIVQHESGWNPNAQNPTSTAYGLFQFLNSTWASTGIAKTSDPAQQSLAGMRYMKNRYGDPIGAQRFWQANGYYGSGGQVEAILPDLMDTGGWIHEGLNVIMNKTGRPEPVINPATLDALISIGEGGGARGPILGAYHQTVISSTPREATDELLHTLDVLDLGGRYPTGVGS